jgi:hypothetical protein
MAGVVSPMARACGERTARCERQEEKIEAAHSSRERKRAKQTSIRTKGPISLPLSLALLEILSS